MMITTWVQCLIKHGMRHYTRATRAGTSDIETVGARGTAADAPNAVCHAVRWYAAEGVDPHALSICATPCLLKKFVTEVKDRMDSRVAGIGACALVRAFTMVFLMPYVQLLGWPAWHPERDTVQAVTPCSQTTPF
eukprot:TRINITY_DN25722_c0_g1_i1.p1 TRINITY_DN25722_c0_g1~~TRINITY_DN25722_c0_g1_i1.p1  ORF type:complete len:135 (-),score=2.39 TRINITY_DN25722_c0_g1_i1:42-446(-)